MSFSTVHSKLYTILKTLEGNGKDFAAVYNYFKPDVESFPVAMVAPAPDSTEIKLDSNSNQLEMVFDIYIFVDKEISAAKSTERMNLTDAVLDVLRKKEYVDTLGGIVNNIDDKDIRFFDQLSHIALMGTQISIRAKLCKTFG